MRPSRSCRQAAPAPLLGVTRALLLLLLLGLIGCTDDGHGPDRSGGSGLAGRQTAARVGDEIPIPVDRSLLSPELLLAIDAALARRPSEDTGDAHEEDGNAWLELGMVYDANGLDDLADRAYAGAAERIPGDPRPPYHRARVLARTGRIEAALTSMGAALALAPEHTPGHWRRGHWLLDAGRLDEAEAAFERAVALAPDDLGGLLGRARVALVRDDAPRARDLLSPLVERHPELGEIRFLLGSALRQLGELDAAAEHLARWDGEPAPLFDPWEVEVARHLAGYQAVMDQVVAWGLAGEAGLAVGPLEDLHRRAPDDSAVLEKLVAAYLDTDRGDEAHRVVTAALRRDDSHYRSWYALALVEERAGRLPAALDAAHASLERHATWSRGHELLARLSWRSGDLTRAAESLQDALRFGGPDPVNLMKRARALALLDRWPEALVDLESARAAEPASAELLALIAEARAETGDLAGAWRDFGAAAELDRDHAQVPRVLARLVQLDPEQRARGRDG